MNESVVVLTSLVSLAMLWVMLFWLYQSYRVELFRQEMFALRDQLFDSAIENDIPFDSPSYQILRITMNGTIRFAHRISFVQLLALGLIGKQYELPSNSFNTRIKESLRNLNADQSNVVEKHYSTMNMLIARHVILSSPILLVTIIVPAAFLFVAKNKMAKLNKELKRPLDKIDSAAFAAGQS